jgi:hypothetical protein
MAVQRNRARKGRRGDFGKLLAALFLTTVALGAGGIGLYIWATAPRPPLRDQKTFCPIDGPSAVTVMLLDTSDPLPAPTTDEVVKRLTDIADELPDYALLEIRTLDPGHRAGRVVFSLCNPGDGRGLNEFTGNPSLAKRRWKERFRGPLDEALITSLRPAPSGTSPILATLQGIALDRFTGKAADEMPKSLVIVSDMIEYGKEYSQYPPADLSYQRFRTNPLYAKVRTNLNDARVEILYVQRRPKGAPLDYGAHIRFWLDWIQDNRGQFRGAVKLQG